MERERETEKPPRAVPKFGSFKPNPGPGLAPATGETDGGRGGDGKRRGEVQRSDRGGERERHQHRNRENDREGNRDRERRRARRAEHRTPRRGSPKPATAAWGQARDHHTDPVPLGNAHAHAHAVADDLFTIDRRGDPLILQYGSNDRSRVPAYYRAAAGRIIGARGFLTIHRDGPNEQFSISHHRGGDGHVPVLRDKALVAASTRLQSRRIRPATSPDEPPPNPSDDFIPLLPSRKRKRGHDSPSSPSSSSSTSSSPPPSPSTSPTTTPAQTLATTLTTHLQSHPADTPAWLALIGLQPTLVHSTTTADETAALAALKLALYEQALPHAPSPTDRERLLAGLMAEGARVWDRAVLRRRWAGLVEGTGGRGLGLGLGLWRAWVGFLMAGGVLGENGGAGVEGLMGRLGGVPAGEERAEEAGVVCEEVVYVLLMLTRLLGDAGFGELAVAAWQAVLEMVFCRPGGVADGMAPALELFAEFWESEVPRIGEAGARGWRRFVEAGEGADELLGMPGGTPASAPRTSDPLRDWAAAEQQAAEKARMPARTLDDGVEDDPFRVVMFSDIKDLLVWFPSAVLAQVRPLLLDAFLVFCGLPAAGLSGDRFAALLSDPLVAGRDQGLSLALALRCGDRGTEPDLSRRTPEFRQQGGSMAIAQDVLFSGDTWFRYLDKWSNAVQPGDRQVDVAWVLGTLGRLVQDCGIEELAEYYLAMEWRNEPAKARKVAKGLLKQYSSNIRLYSAYALVESANQNPQVSHKVLSSAAGLVSPSTSSQSQLLWNTWAWIHLESGQKDMALARLCWSVDRGFRGSVVSPALLLKARSHFSSTRDYSLSSQQIETAAQHAESLMLLEYLAAEGGSEPASESQGNITAALSSIHHFSQQLPHNQLLLELCVSGNWTDLQTEISRQGQMHIRK
ncbi:DUF1740-domain-containing protein [Trichocladium antarcticum]|uniref:DUF1740-domain-containing protein n=1 Tax=Trichocladium antarcticum TaxID=1450529 RepID=A0AAN6UUU9_9PEZI|nr:DUF1740-domain-containing protein [Trichocladium antarcticum]